MDIFAKQLGLEESNLNEVIQDIETSLNVETINKDEIQEPTTEVEIISEQADIKLPALFVNANTNVAIPTDPNELIEFIHKNPFFNEYIREKDLIKLGIKNMWGYYER